jgi:D-alanine transfer protein
MSEPPVEKPANPVAPGKAAVAGASRRNLWAAGGAVLLGALWVWISMVWCERLEKRYIHALAPEFNAEKLQGVALQSHAFQEPELLVFYGSSELGKTMPNNANQFFEDYPTGFRVFPVGKPGTTSLAILQKVAGVGAGVRGKKLAFSISPGWFFTEIFDPSFYEGNFSEMQANELAFSAELSHALKRDVARRMLAFPKTLQSRPLLRFTLGRLAKDRWVDRFFYGLVWPLGKLHCAVARMQDHVEAALYILEWDEKLNPSPRRGLRGLNWSELLKKAAKFVNAAVIQAKRNEIAKKQIPKSSRDGVFMESLVRAREWTDFELLLRTFVELGAQPLLLSIPIEDIRLEVYGISASSRAAYTGRMRKLANKYGIPLADFPGSEASPGFTVDFLDHLSGEGWLHYNKALDDFFHGRFQSQPVPGAAQATP